TDAAGNANTPVTLTSFDIDLTAPTLAEVTAVATPSSDTTPDVTFSTTEAGTLAVTGSCGSAAEGAISSGSNTITLTQSDNSTPLAEGTYSDCALTVTDSSGNESTVLTLTSFVVDVAAPVLAEVTAVTTPSNDTTPNVTFSSTEAGTLIVGGSCGSASEGAISSGSQTIALTQPDNTSGLASGSYNDCTLAVSDAASNTSNVITLTSFVVDVSGPTLTTNLGISINEGDTGQPITATELAASDDVSVAANVTYGIVSAPANGSLTLNGSPLANGGSFTQEDIANGLVDYDHDGGETTSDAFTFTLTDGLGNLSNNGGSNFSFTIIVATQNDAPQTTADTATTNEDNAVMVDVLANDADSDDAINAASVTVTTAPANGSTSVNTASGVITYTPAANYYGADTFNYTVQDATGATSVVTLVTITVNSVNDAPVAVGDVTSMNFNTVTTIDVVANDTDVDIGDAPDASTLAIVSAASNGSAVVVAGEIQYTPTADFTGNDTFTYTVNDSNAAMSNVATVTVTVIDPNVVPVAVDDNATTDEDTAVVINVLANDSDGDGSLETSTVVVTTAPTNGTTAINTTTGEITYTPASNYFGSDAFTYTVEDNLGATSVAATVNLTVASVNDAPVANSDMVNLLEDASLTINVLGNDTDVDGSLVAASVVIVLDPSSGVVAVDPADGSVTYTPNNNFIGYDVFSYQVTDNNGAVSNVTDVGLTVENVNDAPLANADSAEVIIGVATSINLTANDSDIDGSVDPATIEVTLAPSQGTLTDNKDGTVTYTANAGADVTAGDTFSYTVNDDSGATSNAATVQIQFVPAAAPLLTGTPSADVEEDGNYSFTPEVTVGDSNFDLTYSVTGAPSWLSFDASSGTLMGMPSAADVGVASGIQISVSDGSSSVVLPAFDITVVARVDTDSDTITDYQEGKDGTDPNNSADYLDLTPPDLTAPNDILLDAIGLFTEVNTAQLLGLPANADSDLVDAAIAELVSDNVDGNGCCNLYPIGAVGDKYKFAPGVNNIVWLATDNKNNTTEVTQKVYIRPLVSLSNDSVNTEGGVAEIRIMLNGKAPFYPFQVPYIIDANSTTTSADHDLVEGVITFNQGQTSVKLNVNITQDDVAENDEQLIVRLDDQTTNAEDLQDGFDADIYDINVGTRVVHRLTIIERNVAPQLTLAARQNGVPTSLVARDGGTVTVSASVIDPNSADTHSYSWANRRGNLTDVDGNSGDATFTFDPSNTANGAYKIALTVTDSAGASDTETVNLVVVAATPVLSAVTDSDNDGIDDASEGTADADADGIPDYLDNIAETNVLPAAANETDAFLLECEPGVHCRLGLFAQAGQSGGARLGKDDIAEQADLSDDPYFTLAGDLFDFELAELPSAGQTVRIVIPLQEPVPANGVYRKFMNGVWSTFVEDANNSLESSAGELGYCPPPGADSYQSGLIEGYLCVQLTIEDGGPNDADGVVNASVEDPGGIAVQKTQTVSTRASGGGSTGPLLLVLLGGLAWASRKKPLAKKANNQTKVNPNLSGKKVWGIKSNVAASALAAIALSFPTEKSYALDWQAIAKDSFAEVSVGRASGSQSKSDFERGMQQDGLAVTTTHYDTKSTTFQLLLGYHYNDNFSATIGYLDLGEVAADFNLPADDDESLRRSIKKHHPYTGSGLTLGARYQRDLYSKLNGFVEAGVFVWQGDVVSIANNADTDLDGSIDPYFAVGAAVPLNENVSIGLKYQYHVLDDQSVSLTGAVFNVSF
uniref:tandem-95 repeat protein n=1 Tax=Teredinibacter waterburyi TaxID=1500538 RepID=UPI00165F9B32